MTTATVRDAKLYGEFVFDRGAIKRYWSIGALIVFAGMAPFTFGATLLMMPPLWIYYGLLLRRLRYEVDEDSVNVYTGVFFRQEKVIPLEKITDIKLLQGPLMRCFGVYTVFLQTAGNGNGMPEATMTFESHAKAVEVRERIMTARQRFRSGLLSLGTGDE